MLTTIMDRYQPSASRFMEMVAAINAKQVERCTQLMVLNRTAHVYVSKWLCVGGLGRLPVEACPLRVWPGTCYSAALTFRLRDQKSRDSSIFDCARPS